MFGFLKRKSKEFLGVDIGAGGIKVAEFESLNSRPHLLNYGYAERPVDLFNVDILDDAKQAGELLAKICQKSQIKSAQAIASLPIYSVFSSVLNIRPASEKEMEAAIEIQAKKLLPFPFEEAVLDWKIIDDHKDKNVYKEHRILLTAAPKSLIDKYVEIFKAAKIQLLYLETEAFALIRSLIGKDKSVITIIDIGAARTNILIADAGMPIVTRSINIGGAMITKSLNEIMQVSLNEAELLKRDIKNSKRVLEIKDSQMPKNIETLLMPIVNEIKYCFNIYLKENANNGLNRGVEKVILTGGASIFPYLPDYFSKMLDIKVFVGNPWARVLFPDDLRPDLDELGAKFSVAVGLAMREIE